MRLATNTHTDAGAHVRVHAQTDACYTFAHKSSRICPHMITHILAPGLHVCVYKCLTHMLAKLCVHMLAHACAHILANKMQDAHPTVAHTHECTHVHPHPRPHPRSHPRPYARPHARIFAHLHCICAQALEHAYRSTSSQIFRQLSVFCNICKHGFCGRSMGYFTHFSCLGKYYSYYHRHVGD